MANKLTGTAEAPDTTTGLDGENTDTAGTITLSEECVAAEAAEIVTAEPGDAESFRGDFDFEEAGADLGGLADPNQVAREDPNASTTPSSDSFRLCSVADTLSRL